MYKTELVKELIAATKCTLEFCEKKISARDFIKEYDNFYYKYALDGHEANKEQKYIIKELKKYIDIHEVVQTKIIDLVFFDNNAQADQYLKAGRITEVQALNSASKIDRKYDLKATILSLEKVLKQA